MGRRGATIRLVGWLALALGLALPLGCGQPAATVVEGYLRWGDRDYWLVDATLVAIGGAQVGGEPSRVGSAVRAEGRRLPDGTFAATRIVVGAADPARGGGTLPAASASGAVEAQDPATGRWRVAGRAVQLAPGLAAPAGIGVGDRVRVAGYALPDGVLLAAEVVADRPAATPTPGRTPAPAAPPPTATPASPPPAATATPPPPAATAVPPPPAAPGPPVEPPGKPGGKPTKEKDQPGGDKKKGD